MSSDDGITVHGKRRPVPEQVAGDALAFDQIELYLEPGDCTPDRIAEIDELLSGESIEVGAVHTPHVSVEELDLFQRTDELACAVDAEYVVVHSGKIPLKDAGIVEDRVDWQMPHGYELSPGESLRYIENAVFEQGLEFVLDTAHLWMGSPAYKRAMRELLTGKHANEIGWVHLADASPVEDGVAFGDGEMPIDWSIEVLLREYSGGVTLEVPVEDQAAALEQWGLVAESHQD